MDEVLRRRLVGAAVLLTGAFLLASLLPEPGGRARGGARRGITYDLRTGETLHEPAAPEGVPPAPADPEVTPGAESAEEPPPAAAPATRPTLKVDESLDAPTGAWYLQIGSFENQVNARNVLQKLYTAGLPTAIQSMSVGKKLWYRVRVGPFADEASAQKALVVVRKEGYPLAKLVRPDPPSGDARN